MSDYTVAMFYIIYKKYKVLLIKASSCNPKVMCFTYSSYELAVI